MIIVIADDLSGAAELAGAAARLGYKAEVQTVLDTTSDAEVIALDTATRTLPAAKAARVVAKAARAAKSAWIYKKTDSVLRGNVVEELDAVIHHTGHRRVLLVPANPSRKRIIRKGIYFVEGVQLAKTAFVHDPDHPRRSSRVSELLDVNSAKTPLSVPDTCSAAHITSHARAIDDSTLPAGGVDFFKALLKLKSGRRSVPDIKLKPVHYKRTLFVCGSAAAWDKGRANECAARGIPVHVMPEDVFSGSRNTSAIRKWSKAAATSFQKNSHSMLAVGRPSSNRSKLKSADITTRFVEAVAGVIKTASPTLICIEGGATAAILLRRFGWTRLKALPANLTGIGVLKPANGPLLLIKPGSYPWPKTLWAKFEKCWI